VTTRPGITVRVGARELVLAPAPAQLMMTLPRIIELAQEVAAADEKGDAAETTRLTMDLVTAKLEFLAAGLQRNSPELQTDQLVAELGAHLYLIELGELFGRFVQLSTGMAKARA